MKIGILTFHWATNYGAVLQAYALMDYLKSCGAEAEIIDYYPKRYKRKLLCAVCVKRLSKIPSNIRSLKKENKIEEFRKKYLIRSKYYPSNDKLRELCSDYDCYICGSDQVWNEFFLANGERKITGSYFLDFAPNKSVIASYAASFGCAKYNDKLKPYIKNFLSEFNLISVRENTGLNILNDIGIEGACVVPDPTLLLEGKAYERFVLKAKRKEKYNFVYMLHDRMQDANKLMTGSENTNVVCGNIGIEDWLTEIYYSDLVITNSFHGTVFSILFEKPFVSVLIDGSGMNDRIVTLLTELGLQDRIYKGNNEIVNESIDWNAVKEKLVEYRKTGYDYLDRILNYNKEE